jgi:nitrogen regulatory protein PII/nitrogen regulatory protein PII-like uncharacterized protein
MMYTMQKLLLIVNAGEASKAFQIAKEAGVIGGTILLGQGTSSNKWLKILGLDDIRKEILIILAPNDVAQHTAQELVQKLQLEKPNRGILALQNVARCYGSRGLGTCEVLGGEKVEHEFVLITVIVDRGRSHDVMETATLAGARGGTIVHGRGSGTKKTATVFNVPIMPEKDIILLLMTADGADAIVEAIQKDLSIDEPGQGIIFTQPVEQVFGMSATASDHIPPEERR